MSIIVFVLVTAGQVLLHMLAIAAMSIPAGIGLAIGYAVGKKFVSWFGRKKIELEHKDLIDEFTITEQTT